MKVKDLIKLLKEGPPEAEVRVEAYFDPQMFVGLKAAVSVDGALSDGAIQLDLVVDGD